MHLNAPKPQPPSTPQAAGSSTFIPPPLDAALGLHQIYDFHLQNSSTHPLFTWESKQHCPRTLTWGEVAKGTHRAAHFITRHTQTRITSNIPPVIAILAFTDTITSICLMLGLIRAGYQSFWISPRNSVTAVCHLLDAVGSTELIVHGDGPLRALASAAQAESTKPLSLLPLPNFADFFPENEETFQPFQSAPFNGLDTPAVVMHSSGSTSFPKPRTFTHRILIQQSQVPWFGQVDLCGEILASHAVPMFHAQGLYNSCLPASTGLVLSVFPPELPTAPPDPEKVIHGLKATNSTMLICVPSFLEYWAQNPENVSTLSKLKAIFCGGALLNQLSCDIYREGGAQMICYLAATEYGIATLMVPKRAPHEGFEWLSFSPHLTPIFLPQDDPEIYELVFLASPVHTPAVINTQIEGHDAYATNDLFLRHPTTPDLWKVHGRTDDQIMLSTGEKTNPGPIEAIIGHSPHVKTCVMFGRGRFQNGIIIEPTVAFDPSDVTALLRFKNDIWPAVEEANVFAPSHSRIFKEMVVVSHPSKPFEYTLKNTPKRQATIAAYEAEIDAAYAAVTESAQREIPPPSSWSLHGTVAFIRRVVSEVSKASDGPICDEGDIFASGYDSLQVTWIRNSILRALRESGQVAVAKELPLNFVYEYPSIMALTRYLVDVVAGRPTAGDPGAVSVTALKLQLMEDLIAKHTANFPSRPVAGSDAFVEVPESQVVVLTGSTGSLGSQILASLVENVEVARVYALNRCGAVTVQERQAAMWEDHDLDPRLLTSGKIVFVGVDASEGLKIAEDIADEIRASATIIIHNAWSVDFNKSLSSFEPNISALRALIDLALQSSRAQPPRFIFTSTIGVVRNWTFPSAVPEAPLEDMSLSLLAGYTESKCVAERVVSAASAAGLQGVVVRIGQLAGAPNGSWRRNEWVPAIVQSGQALGALPDVHGGVSWIPLQTAAESILELARADSHTSDGAVFVHLVHPRPVPWRTVIKPISEALGVPLVPYDDWLQRLEQSAAVGEDIRAVRLLEFFRSVRMEGGGRGDAMGFPTLDTREIERRAPRALGVGLRELGREDAQRWIGHWRRKGFLSNGM